MQELNSLSGIILAINSYLCKKAKLLTVAMRTLTVLVLFLILFPSVALTQTGGISFLAGVSQAMVEEKWDKANDLFKAAIEENAEKAEDFYWKNVRPDCRLRKSLAMHLGLYYKESRNYDKAASYYQELIRIVPQDIKCLAQCAAIEVQRGEQQMALDLYQKVLTLDENHLEANIFIGNYYYFYADKERRELVADYSKLAAPTRMQHARYRDGLIRIVTTGYDKAKGYLQRVLNQFPSTEVRKTLNRIEQIEKEAGK